MASHLSNGKKRRVLRCFQDVKTRWDSTCQMLIRIYTLQEAVNLYTANYCPHLSLSKDEWDQIKYLITLLRPFQFYTSFISTTRSPTIHRVFEIYNILLEHFEKAKKKLGRKKKDWKSLLYQGLEAAENKLKDYYERTTEKFGYFYGLAILLTPHQKDTFWRNHHLLSVDQWDSWEAEYWQEFEKLYDEEYASQKVQARRVPANLKKLRQPAVDFDLVMDQIANLRAPQLQEPSDASEAEIELMDYRQYSELYSGSTLVVR